MEYKKGLVLILIIVEIAMACLITFTEATPELGCVQGFQCGTVLTSSYSHIGPITVSEIGIICFVILLIVFLLTYYKKIRKEFFLGIVCLGAIGSLTLISIQHFLINAWCSKCLITDTIMLIIAGITIYSYIKEKAKKRR